MARPGACSTRWSPPGGGFGAGESESEVDRFPHIGGLTRRDFRPCPSCPRERALVADYARVAADGDRRGEYLAACEGAPLSGADSYVAAWFRKRLAYDSNAGLLRSTW